MNRLYSALGSYAERPSATRLLYCSNDLPPVSALGMAAIETYALVRARIVHHWQDGKHGTAQLLDALHADAEKVNDWAMRDYLDASDALIRGLINRVCDEQEEAAKQQRELARLLATVPPVNPWEDIKPVRRDTLTGGVIK